VIRDKTASARCPEGWSVWTTNGRSFFALRDVIPLARQGAADDRDRGATRRSAAAAIDDAHRLAAADAAGPTPADDLADVIRGWSPPEGGGQDD